MDLPQLTVYEHFGWINIRSITLLYVDQSSSRRLVVRNQDTHTSFEVVVANTVNFRPNFKFSRSKVLGDPHPHFNVRYQG